MKLIGALLVLAFISVVSSYKSYNGYQVLRTAPVTHASMRALSLMQSDPRFDFWAQPHVGRPTDVMVAPEHVGELRATLQDLDLHPSIYIPDVGITLKKERADIEITRQREENVGLAVSFERYMELDEIQSYIDELANTYPDLATIIEIGESYEGRPIRVLKISNGGQKKSIFLESLIHGREWSSGPLSLHTAAQLLEKYETNKELVDLMDWYILPVANPDGYLYTWTDDRFWRKTRSLNNIPQCVGTDLNRNFDFHWNEGPVSENECSLNYPGKEPFSESETRALRDFWNELNANGELAIYMAIHSYAKALNFPYAYAPKLPINGIELMEAGKVARDAVFAYNFTWYFVEQASENEVLTWGTSLDYAFSVAEIPFSYTWNLMKGGPGGYNPPASLLGPLTLETFAGIAALVRHVASLES